MPLVTLSKLLAIPLLFTAFLCSDGFAEPDEKRSDKRSLQQLDAIFNRQLDAISKSGEQSPIFQQYAKNIRIEADPSRMYLHVGRTTLPSSRSVGENRNLEKIHQLRKQYAQQVYQLVDQRMKNKRYGEAYRLLNRVAFHDPKHIANRILAPAFQVANVSARRGRSPHRQIGWKKGSYWVVNSSDFQISTNADRQQAVGLARQLQDLKHAWQQVFFEFWSSGDVLKAALQKKAGMHRNRKKHRVVLFANRQDYVEHIQRLEPLARMTLGFYSTTHKTSYFFIGENADETKSTWLHEATHQLFQETKRVRPDVGFRSDFWLIEGLALYMESLTKVGHYWSVGGIESERLQFSRFRRMREKFYLPFDEFAKMGQSELQKHADIRKLYSQAAGLSHFFLDPRQSSQRDAFLQYVSTVYAGRGTHVTLLQSLKQDSQSIDSSYLEFLTVTDQDLTQIDQRVQPKSLVIGRCPVTDDGIRHINLERIKWLDLSQSTVSGKGLSKIATAHNVLQLALENTNVDDAFVRQLQDLQKLQELDLSGTKVSDQSMSVLADLASLKRIWLANTKVSEAVKRKLGSKLAD